MALTKTPQEIEIMRRGGAILSRALAAAAALARPGAIIRDLDAAAEASMRAEGAAPAFKGYQTAPSDPPFPSTVCISVNQEVVHGLGNRGLALREGDIVGLDIGCWYQGLCTDMAITVPVGKVSAEDRALMDATRAATLAGVAAAKVGNAIRDISAAVEGSISAASGSASGGKPHGYGIVRALVGHGVGHKVHEAPQVPNYVSPLYRNVKITDGMCLAIEPMVTRGGWQVKTAPDEWTVVTVDGSRAAHFELTVACTEQGTEILTPWPVGY